MANLKQYGLIMKKAKSAAPLKSKLSVFQEDSDEESAHTAVNTSLQQEAKKKKINLQTQMEIEKALEEDPTVYEYDSIYDDMEKQKQKKHQAIKSKKSDSKPKYIEGLLKAANQRKREREKQQERKIQREREKEGEMFGDKEAFVTSSYKKKMQEMAEEEERERLEAEQEAANDVTKQQDMSGFYRHILAQTTGEITVKEEGDKVLERNKGKEIVEDRLTSGDSDERGSRKDQSQKREKWKDDEGFRDRDERRKRSEERTDSFRRRGKQTDEQKHRDNDRYRRNDDEHEGRRGKDLGKNSCRSGRRERSPVSRKRRSTSPENYDRSSRSSGRSSSSKHEQSRNEDTDRYAGKDRDSDRHRHSDKERRSDSERHSDQERQSDKGEHSDKQESNVGTSENERLLDSAVSSSKGKEQIYARKNTRETVMSAKERYLARKMARNVEKAYIAPEED